MELGGCCTRPYDHRNKEAQSTRPGSDHPSTILNEAQKVELSAGIFIGQLTLYVSMYRGAAKHLSTDQRVAEEKCQGDKGAHTRDARSAQYYFHLSDIHVSLAFEGSGFRAGNWVEAACVACRKNFERL